MATEATKQNIRNKCPLVTEQDRIKAFITPKAVIIKFDGPTASVNLNLKADQNGTPYEKIAYTIVKPHLDSILTEYITELEKEIDK